MIVFFLIMKSDKKLRKLNRKNKTMLHYAARGNSLWMIELQISKGADINAIDLKFQNFIVFSLIKIIQNNLGKLKTKNKTPLHYAADSYSIEKVKKIVSLLISRGAKINVKDN